MDDLEFVRSRIDKLLDAPELTPGQETLLKELKAEYKELRAKEPAAPAVAKQTPWERMMSPRFVDVEQQAEVDALTTHDKNAPAHPWYDTKTAEELRELSDRQPAEFLKFLGRHPDGMELAVKKMYLEMSKARRR
jgi:hypothetical protein